MAEDSNEIKDIENPKAEINALLEVVKQDIEFIKSSGLEIEKTKTASHQARGAIEADMAAISESKARYSKLKDEAQAEAEELKNAQIALKSKIDEVAKRNSALEKLVNELEAIKKSAEQSRNSVEQNIKTISETKAQFETLRQEAQTRAGELKNEQDALKGKIKDINDNHVAIEGLFTKLLVDTKDESGNITSKCVNSSIDDMQSKINAEFAGIQETHKKLENKFEILHTTLEDNIRSLLPGAGAAGLASAYFEAKGRYGSVPYDPSGKGMGIYAVMISKIAHFIKNNIGTMFYYTMFIVPLVFLYGVFKDLKIDTLTPGIFLFRLLIATPLGVLSYFGFSSIRMNRRLYEEYNHKQRVMQLYHSFKEQIGEKGTEQQKQDLIAIMLGVVKDKPSLTMRWYERGIGNFFSLLGVRNKGGEEIDK